MQRTARPTLKRPRHPLRPWLLPPTRTLDLRRDEAGAREGESHGFAEASGRTGDEGDLPGEAEFLLEKRILYPIENTIFFKEAIQKRFYLYCLWRKSF